MPMPKSRLLSVTASEAWGESWREGDGGGWGGVGGGQGGHGGELGDGQKWPGGSNPDKKRAIMN